MKKSLALLLALLLCVSLYPAALGAETLSAVTAAAPEWVAEEDYLIFPGDPVYEPERWGRITALRAEAEAGALLPEEGRDWAEGSAGQCYETALLRLKYAGNAGEDEGLAKAAFLSAGKAFEAAESAWYDQSRGRDGTYYRLRVEKYRAYLLYHPQYVDNWGRAIVPALDALGMTTADFFEAPHMERVGAETRDMVEQSADAYWSFYLPEKSRLTIYVDDILLQMDTQPQVKNQRTMAPVRALAEALGAEVMWDPETWQVTMTRAGHTVTMTPGETTAWVDGAPIEMDVAPYADQNRTYFPVRYAAQLFGQTVTWNAGERRVDITEDKEGTPVGELEAWAGPMSALLGFSEGGDPRRFGLDPRAPHTVTRRDANGVPREVELVSAEHCRAVLAGWEVGDREELLAAVEELLETGNDPDFQAAAREVRYLSDSEIARRANRLGETDRYMWPRTKAMWNKWGEKGIRAWDLCRAVTLCQWGYTAGYVTYGEALDMARPAIEELAGTFTGWDEVYENFLEGYYWCLREDLGEKTVWETELGLGYLYLKNAPETRTLFNDDMFGASAER